MTFHETTPEFEAILDYLKHKRGCDLTGYKRSTLIRRFQHRMQSLKIERYSSYLQYLQSHPEEFLALLNDVLINVTSFFRDSETWTHLANEVIPTILANKAPDESIRIWSAGCATGQEIYSVLMLFAEALGISACLQRVQCYATDADEVALQQARKGQYSALEVSNVSADLLEKYFEPVEHRYRFHSQLRRTIVFGRHDLTQNAPMSKMDLILCRNVLIYFNPETQASILVRFHFALKKTGFLVLGKSEMLVHSRQIFIPVYLRHRVYTKGLELDLADHLTIQSKYQPKFALNEPLQPAANSLMHFWQTGFESNPLAQFAIDLEGNLLGANEQAHRWFDLTPEDWHCPFEALVPGKLLARYATAKPLYGNHHGQTLKQVIWEMANCVRYFEVTIAPVFNAQKQLLGSTVTFLEVSDRHHLAERVAHTQAELSRVSGILAAIESERETTRLELEAAYQELKLLAQDPQSREL